MNLPSEIGRYIAAPRTWGVSEQGQNNIPTFACEFELRQHWNGTEWADISADRFEITGWFYLFKKDGQPNDFTIKALKESLGWDGRSIGTLNDGEWSQTEVQLSLAYEEYNGKQKLKVQFINPRDSVPGGVERSDPQTVQSLDQKYGAVLRAMNGAANGKAAPKPAAKPAAKATTPDGKAAAWKVFQEVWAKYIEERPDEAPNRDAKWKEAYNEFFQGADPKTISAEQWKKFTDFLPTWDIAGIPF